jgi:hypothetical protein
LYQINNKNVDFSLFSRIMNGKVFAVITFTLIHLINKGDLNEKVNSGYNVCFSAD